MKGDVVPFCRLNVFLGIQAVETAEQLPHFLNGLCELPVRGLEDIPELFPVRIGQGFTKGAELAEFFLDTKRDLRWFERLFPVFMGGCISLANVFLQEWFCHREERLKVFFQITGLGDAEILDTLFEKREIFEGTQGILEGRKDGRRIAPFSAF